MDTITPEAVFVAGVWFLMAFNLAASAGLVTWYFVAEYPRGRRESK